MGDAPTLPPEDQGPPGRICSNWQARGPAGIGGPIKSGLAMAIQPVDELCKVSCAVCADCMNGNAAWRRYLVGASYVDSVGSFSSLCTAMV